MISKWLFVLMLFNGLQLLPAQELSLSIPVSEKRADAGIQMIELDDGYLILSISLCDENAPFARCLDLVRLNRDGKVVWKRIYNGWPDSNLNTSGRTLAVYQNTIYLATEIWKTDHNELRMMAFDMEGHLLYEKVSIFAKFTWMIS